MTKSLNDKMNSLSRERQNLVKERADKIIADEINLTKQEIKTIIRYIDRRTRMCSKCGSPSRGSFNNDNK